MSLQFQPKPNGIAARALAAAAVAGLPLSAIRVDGGTQSRALLQDSIIAEYAAALADGVTFPPVVIFYDGSDHWLADGFHRVRAFAAAGRDTIPADVRQGTRRDAILYSVGANETHGLRRTNDDKRRAVMTLLDDAEWSKWSDREIGRLCRVSHEFVRKLRPLTVNVDSDERTYTTKHGTTATMNTAAIGKSVTETKDTMGETSNGARQRVPNTWVKIVVPEGQDIIELCRRGIAMERDGASAIEAAKSVGLSDRTYAVSRQIVMLADNADLASKDAATAKLALDTLSSTLQLQRSWEIVEALAARVWGDGTRFNLTAIADKRLDQFERTFGIIMQTCTTTDEVELPYLTADRAKKALRQIGSARSALARFADRIKEIHE